MINLNEVSETNEMIEKENLDVRTITMGISLLDCIDSDLEKVKNPEDTTHWDLKSKSRRAISTGICLFKMPVGKYPPAFASFQNPGGHYPLAASLMHLQHCLQNDLQCRFKSPCTTPSPSAFHSASSGAFCHLALSKRLY